MVDTTWHLGHASGPITHHLFLPLNQAEIERSKRKGSFRRLFPSIENVFGRKKKKDQESWIHAVFHRVQVAQYGLKHARELAKVYTSSFYIRSKRTLDKKMDVPLPPGEPPLRSGVTFDLSKPGSFALMRVTVPEGKGFMAGKRMYFLTPEDTTMMVTIPEGVMEGEDFVVKVPKSALVTAEKKMDEKEEDEEPHSEPHRIALDEFLGEDLDDDINEEKEKKNEEIPAKQEKEKKQEEVLTAQKNEKKEEKASEQKKEDIEEGDKVEKAEHKEKKDTIDESTKEQSEKKIEKSKKDATKSVPENDTKLETKEGKQIETASEEPNKNEPRAQEGEKDTSVDAA